MYSSVLYILESLFEKLQKHQRRQYQRLHQNNHDQHHFVEAHIPSHATQYRIGLGQTVVGAVQTPLAAQ